MKIKETFLRLTSRTYPHGTEAEIFGLLPKNLKTDSFGNRFLKIGKNPTTLFASHLDTATQQLTNVHHVINNGICTTDGTSILGADDKAGVTIMLNMIEHNVPGIYYFFLGEEVGCLGSKDLAKRVKESNLENIKRVISFDRRGTDSIITFQMSKRCCSDKFALALAKELNDKGATDYTNDIVFNYKDDNTGLYTDSAQFIDLYPECTNISVGYKNEHTCKETQDLNFLEKFANVAVLIDWENLPTERDHTKVEYKSYSSYYGGGYYGGWDDDWSDWGDDYYSSRYKNTYAYSKPVVVEENEELHFMDSIWHTVSSIKINKNSTEVLSVDFDIQRIEYEEDTIYDFLSKLDISFLQMKWNGIKLVVDHEDPTNEGCYSHSTEVTRKELSEFIPELNFWKDELQEDYNFLY
jgi:hypothetical protein